MSNWSAGEFFFEHNAAWARRYLTLHSQKKTLAPKNKSAGVRPKNLRRPATRAIGLAEQTTSL